MVQSQPYGTDPFAVGKGRLGHSLVVGQPLYEVYPFGIGGKPLVLVVPLPHHWAMLLSPLLVPGDHGLNLYFQLQDMVSFQSLKVIDSGSLQEIFWRCQAEIVTPSRGYSPIGIG